jgi:hypothetical protein
VAWEGLEIAITEEGVMKKFLWVALFALPVLAVSPRHAAASGGCWDLSGCWRIKICLACNMKCNHEPFCCNPCVGGNCGGGYGGGYGGSCGADCSGVVPGPWYTYWPTPGNPYVQSAPQAYPGWTYFDNFQTPAPVYPFWPTSPSSYAGSVNYGMQYTNYQPTNYYPSYWYGR